MFNPCKDNNINNNLNESSIKEEIVDESIESNIESNENSNIITDNTSSSTNKNNKTRNNSSDTNVIKSEDVVEKQETKIDEHTEKKVDTNSFFYSIHQGRIEMSNKDNCLSAGEEIAFIDTIDINYYRCYEVTSIEGKVLGYYLNIFCESGNCDKYKKQIDLSKYR